MQIVITVEQLHTIKEWAEPAVVPILIWIWRRGIRTLRDSLNGIITSNVNRVRDELRAHIDIQLQAHLECDTRHFAELREAMNLPQGKG